MRINLEMPPANAIQKMADGNPGAIHVMCKLLKLDLVKGFMDICQLDLVKGFMDICRLDDLELYGPDIWLAYKDICGSDIKTLRDRLRNNYHTLKEDVQKLHREGRT